MGEAMIFLYAIAALLVTALAALWFCLCAGLGREPEWRRWEK